MAPNPRRRGATFTATARRAQIVQAAIEAIAELGYTRSSYAQIAKRAGLSSTGLISYHFASKEELVEQIVADVAAAGQAFMGPRIDAAPSGRAKLRAYIESNLEYLATHRAQMAAIVEIFDALPRIREEQPAPYLANYEHWVAQLEDLLRDGQRSGELRAFSTGVVAVTIRAAIRAAVHRLAGEPELDPGAYARELADLFDHATATRS